MGEAMPVLIVIELVGATAAQHDAVEEKLDSGPDNPPPGLISHTAAVGPDGLVIADVWDSAEDAQTFFAQLGPALEEAGISPAQPSITPVHHHVTGTGEDAAVVMVVEFDGMTTDDYDAVAADIPDDTHPAVMHVVGVSDSGLIVVDVWGSREEFAAFADAELAPRIGERLGDVTPRIADVHVHEVVPGAAAS
jgi:hypothetical protein